MINTGEYLRTDSQISQLYYMSGQNKRQDVDEDI